MTTEIQQYIIDQTGADDWDAVIEAFEDMIASEIERVIDDGIIEDSDNSALAQLIFNEINKPE